MLFITLYRIPYYGRLYHMIAIKNNTIKQAKM